MGSSFEELEVWKKSCTLSVHLCKLLRNCRDYGMKDQMLRSSISIPSNINVTVHGLQLSVHG
ncbi:MAG: four helix bundle protein [Desulfobacteraceae bacterium]|nr:four helix bundle protein [Desulfobacteraceae bacterium]